MNEAIAGYLRERIAEATRKLEEARHELLAASAKEQMAQKQLNAYQGTLDFELMGSEVTTVPETRNGVTPIRTIVIPELAQEGDEGDGETNALLVRKFFRERGSRGVRPHDLNRFFDDTGMTVHKNYAYSILARLKKRKEITARNGRYYATALLLDRIASIPAIEKEATVAAS
jgi:hypothetical protein